MEEEKKEYTREEVKIQLLLERISRLEDEKADLRIELMAYAQQLQQAEAGNNVVSEEAPDTSN